MVEEKLNKQAVKDSVCVENAYIDVDEGIDHISVDIHGLIHIDEVEKPLEYVATSSAGVTTFRCDRDEAPDEWFESPYPFEVEVTDVVNNPEDDVEGRDEVMEVIDNYSEFTEPYKFSSGSIAFNVEEEDCDIVRPLGKRIVEHTGRVITGIRVRNGRLQIWTDPLQTPEGLED